VAEQDPYGGAPRSPGAKYPTLLQSSRPAVPAPRLPTPAHPDRGRRTRPSKLSPPMCGRPPRSARGSGTCGYGQQVVPRGPLRGTRGSRHHCGIALLAARDPDEFPTPLDDAGTHVA
jgi:hypothetical protein